MSENELKALLNVEEEFFDLARRFESIAFRKNEEKPRWLFVGINEVF